MSLQSVTISSWRLECWTRFRIQTFTDCHIFHRKFIGVCLKCTCVTFFSTRWFSNYTKSEETLKKKKVSLKPCFFTLILFEDKSLSFHSRSGELRTQKLKSHPLTTQSFKGLLLKPGVGQFTAIHATLTARDFFLPYFYPSGPFTCIFSKTSPNFFLRWLWLTPVPV